MALFVPLDASYDQDPKILDLADERAELLFIRSLAYAKRHLSDGFIHRRALAAIAPCSDDVAPAVLAAELVRTGLWTEVERGWRITAWAKRNPLAETILTPSKGLELAHQRHHVKKGVVNEACPLCVGAPVEEPQVTTQVACVDAMRDACYAMPESESVPEPEPSPPSLRTTPVDEQQIRATAVAVGRQLAQDAADPAAYAASITRRILTGDDPTDRERITAALGLGESVETIASGWEPVRPDWLTYGGSGAASGQADGPDTAAFYAGREAKRREQMQDQAPADLEVARSGAQAAREALRAPVAAS